MACAVEKCLSVARPNGRATGALYLSLRYGYIDNNLPSK